MKRALLIGGLALASLPAVALGVDPSVVCTTELKAQAPPAFSSAGAQAAFVDLENGLRQMSTPARQMLPSDLSAWVQDRPFNRAMNSLARLQFAESERASICDHFLQTAVTYRLVNLRPDAIDDVVSNLCGPSLRRTAERTLTAAALDTPADDFPARAGVGPTVRTSKGEQARKWLKGMIRKGSFSVPDWIQLVAADPKNRIVALGDAVDRQWNQLGFKPSDVNNLARVLLGRNISLIYTLNAMGLEDPAADAFASDLNPVQWLELLYLRNLLDQNNTAELKARIKAWKPKDVPYNGEGQTEIGDIIVNDERVNFYFFADMVPVLDKNWAKIYGKGALLNPNFPDKAIRTPKEVSRIDGYKDLAYFKIPAITAEVRIEMKAVKNVIESTTFKSPADFLDAFDMRKIIPDYRVDPMPELDRLRMLIKSAEYYKLLWSKLDEFIAMQPSGADIARLGEITVGLPSRLRVSLATALRRKPKVKDSTAKDAPATDPGDAPVDTDTLNPGSLDDTSNAP